MKYLLLIIFVLTFSLTCMAGKYLAFEKVNKFLYPTQESQKVIDLGRDRSQGASGDCSAFSLSKRLEYLCKMNNDCELNGDEISPLYIQAVNDGGITLAPEQAEIFKILRKLKHNENKKLSLVKESCAPFAQSLYQKWINKEAGESHHDTVEGVRYLNTIYQKSRDCASCDDAIAKQILTKLPKLKIEYHEIKKILKNIDAMAPKEFAHKILIRDTCNSAKNKITLPAFKNKYLEEKDLKNESMLFEKITKLIDRDIPPAISFCLSPRVKGTRVCSLHEAVVSGYRKICNAAKKCKSMLKLQNSWGKTWQDEYQGGWVDADILLKYSLNVPINKKDVKPRKRYPNILTWIEPTFPNKVKKITNKKPTKSSIKKHQKKKVTVTTPQDTKVPTLSNQDVTSKKTKKKQTLFLCKKGRLVEFNSSTTEIFELKKQGYVCKKR